MNTNHTAWKNLEGTIFECRHCPRLVAHREAVSQKKVRRFQSQPYWGEPVPGFGDPYARLLIIGLAPGAHGANRTGRMFTGDASGDWLFRALHRQGFSSAPTSEHHEDGTRLRDAYITAVTRCVPPQNRPTAWEIKRCRPYLVREIELLERVRVVLALGRIAFDGYRLLLREMGYKLPKLTFTHGACHPLGRELPTLVASYHPSRQNTQTGRLTESMLDAVLATARRILERPHTA